MEKHGHSDRELFDAFPTPTFVVSRELRILDMNRAAHTLLGTSLSTVYRQRSGDALHCLNAMMAKDGCHTSVNCGKCELRATVARSLRLGRACRKLMHLRTFDGVTARDLQMMVGASPLGSEHENVLLTLDELSPRIESKQLVPICAHCKKIRDEDNAWKPLESYFQQTVGTKFSHSICPNCLEEHLSE